MTQLEKPLFDLINHIPGDLVINPAYSLPRVQITGIAFDSRQIKPGNIFVALIGENTDGHHYVQPAIKNGAVAVIGMQPSKYKDVPYIQVLDSRVALAYISASFYDFPARKLTVIGVTGTDGKTTTANLIYEILKVAGMRVGMISTVNAVIGNETLDTGFHVTTPESPNIQRYLHQMVYSSHPPITHVVIESTSHGLAQHRVSACDFDIGVVTNITHEHLDYHKTIEAYREAKAHLFTNLALTPSKKQGNPRLAVLNRDDDSYEYLSLLVKSLVPEVNQISFGLHPDADYRADLIHHDGGKLAFTLLGRNSKYPVITNLTGAFNVFNCLAAITTTIEGLNINIYPILEGISLLQAIPGRMEFIDLGQDFKAIVDFAHTPNALRHALYTTRELTRKKVIAVFGSAGLRDRQKRRMMAEISAQLADYTILTAEDPRTESVEAILDDMAAGARAYGASENKTFWRMSDRRDAIRFALSLANRDDVVIVLGKGHEQSMCFGDIEYPWDDRIALRAALAEKLEIDNPKMPYLPSPY